MLVDVYTVFDDKAKVYGHTMCFPNSDVAKRAILDEVQKPNSFLAKYPGDFRIFRVGSFDDASGVISALPKPELVSKVVDLLPKDSK